MVGGVGDERLLQGSSEVVREDFREEGPPFIKSI